MHTSNLLIPPPSSGNPDERTRDQKGLWEKSAQRIERVLPGFLMEAIPPSKPPQEQKQVEQQVEQS